MNYLEIIKSVIDYVAAAIMIWGVLLTVFKILKAEFSNRDMTSQITKKEHIRIFLGSYILLGLEIFIVADILGLIINPDSKDLVLLVVVVVIRTIISFFLGKDMKDAIEQIDRLEKRKDKE